MDNGSQKDDMTRIGGFVRPTGEQRETGAATASPAPPPQPSFPPPASPPPSPTPMFTPPPAPGPSFSPPEPTPSFAPPAPAVPPPGPSFAPSEPAFPPPGPSFVPAEPSPAPPQWPPAQPVAAPAAPVTPIAPLTPAANVLDDMWFVVEAANPPIEYPLREGQKVTVGREANQDIVVMDKTLSRNHLILTRHGDRIGVQVLGLNGLIHGGQVYKSTALELTAPCGLTIGNVTCRIKKKVDTEATILMTDPASQARQQPGFTGPAPERPGPAGPRTAPPVWPPPEDQGPFAPPEQNAPLFPSGQPGTRFPGESPAPAAREFREPVFPGQTSSQGPFGGPAAAPGKGGLGANNRKLLLYGGLGLGLLVVVAVGLYGWLRSPAPPSADSGQPQQSQATQAPPTTPPAQAKPAEPQGQTSSLHSHYLSKAKSYLAEGKPLDACDYLKDIPSTSPLRSEAEGLAKQIPGCSL